MRNELVVQLTCSNGNWRVRRIGACNSSLRAEMRCLSNKVVMEIILVLSEPVDSPIRRKYSYHRQSQSAFGG